MHYKSIGIFNATIGFKAPHVWWYRIKARLKYAHSFSAFVKYSTAQCRTLQCNTVQCSAVQCRNIGLVYPDGSYQGPVHALPYTSGTALCTVHCTLYTALCTALYTALRYMELYYISLHFPALYFTAKDWTVLTLIRIHKKCTIKTLPIKCKSVIGRLTAEWSKTKIT